MPAPVSARIQQLKEEETGVVLIGTSGMESEEISDNISDTTASIGIQNLFKWPYFLDPFECLLVGSDRSMGTTGLKIFSL